MNTDEDIILDEIADSGIDILDYIKEEHPNELNKKDMIESLTDNGYTTYFAERIYDVWETKNDR